MRLTRVSLRRAPGIPEGLELGQLGPGLNLVVGPNASGKTTLGRAVRAALWAEEPFDGWVEVEWRRDGKVLHSSRVGRGRPAWFDDSGEAESPRLPEAHLRRCFGIELDELLSAGAGADATLARRLRLELTDGQDLALVLTAARELTPRSAQAERKAYDEALGALGEVELAHRKLAEDARELGRLDDERKIAKRELSELAQLQRALELARVRREASALADRAASFPPGMSAVVANLPEQREERRSMLERARRDREAAEGTLQETDRKLARAGLSEEACAALAREPLVERRERLERMERARDDARAEIAGLERELEQATAGLTQEALARDAAPLARAELDRLEAALDEEATVQAALREARARCGSTPGPEASDRDEADARPLTQAVALVAAGVIVLAAGALFAPASAGLRAVLVGLGLSAVLIGARVLSRVFEDAGTQRAARELADRARAERAAAQENLRRAEGRQAEARAARDAALGALGLDPAAGTLTALALARRLAEREAIAARLAGSRAAQAQLELDLGAELRATAALLARHARSAPDDAPEARAGLAELARALESAPDLHRLNADQERALARAHGREEEARAALAAIYTDLGLEPGDDRGIDLRAARATEWHALESELGEKRLRSSMLERELGERVALAERGVEALEEEIESRRALEVEVDELTDRIKGIEARCDLARQKDDLERALAARERAHDALVRRREDLELGEVARLLVEDVESAHRREAQPALVRGAAQHFERFTRARYTLAVAGAATPDDLPLEVLEEGRSKRIGELSAGTRAQLRLALRLAVAEAAEVGEPLPLFLDEALATSDPERFDAIAVALGELAADGRQVFLLTSDADEAQRFGEALARAGLAAPVRKDLERTVRRAVVTPLEPRSRRTPPDPTGHTAESYLQALGLPALDPFGTLEEVHLGWVLHDDLEGLAAMLRAGGETVGRARRLHERGLADAWDAHRAEAFERRTRALSAFLAAFRAGRGRKLDVLALQQGPLAGSTLLTGVERLAEELGWDARRLIAALREGRVKGFRSQKIDQAEADWTERGALDPRAPLDLQGCEDAVIEALQEELRARPAALPELRTWLARWWSALQPGA